jgi:hypothetical protein
MWHSRMVGGGAHRVVVARGGWARCGGRGLRRCRRERLELTPASLASVGDRVLVREREEPTFLAARGRRDYERRRLTGVRAILRTPPTIVRR